MRVEFDKTVKEKDHVIETLTLKVNTMCVQFETLFHVSESSRTVSSFHCSGVPRGGLGGVQPPIESLEFC